MPEQSWHESNTYIQNGVCMKPYTAANFQAAMHGLEPRMEELAYLQARLEPANGLLAQAQPLTGTVFTDRGPMELPDALVAFDVGTVIYRFGTWVVTGDGIACLVHHYPLTTARLHEQQDWASHLAEQGWVNLWDFLRALAVASHVGKRGSNDDSHGDAAQPS